MAHPKHHAHGHDAHKENPKKNNLWPILFVAAVLAAWGLWAIVTWKPNTPTPSPCCKPTPAPVPVVQDHNLNHIIVARAWCDHMPVWKEGPERRHVLVSARPEVFIQSVEVRHNDKLLGASVRLGTHSDGEDNAWVHLHGAFDEGMHGKDLAVTVTYIVKGVKYQTILHCSILVTN